MRGNGFHQPCDPLVDWIFLVVKPNVESSEVKEFLGNLIRVGSEVGMHISVPRIESIEMNGLKDGLESLEISYDGTHKTPQFLMVLNTSQIGPNLIETTIRDIKWITPIKYVVMLNINKVEEYLHLILRTMNIELGGINFRTETPPCGSLGNNLLLVGSYRSVYNPSVSAMVGSSDKWGKYQLGVSHRQDGRNINVFDYMLDKLYDWYAEKNKILPATLLIYRSENTTVKDNFADLVANGLPHTRRNIKEIGEEFGIENYEPALVLIVMERAINICFPYSDSMLRIMKCSCGGFNLDDRGVVHPRNYHFSVVNEIPNDDGTVHAIAMRYTIICNETELSPEAVQELTLGLCFNNQVLQYGDLPTVPLLISACAQTLNG